MTAAGFGVARSAASTGRARLLAWHVTIHALMLLLMIVAMRPASTAIDHLVCVGGIVVATMGAARFARTRRHVMVAIVDVWAMALLILADVMCGSAPRGGGPHEHGGSVPVLVALVAVGAGWSITRLCVTERHRLGGSLVTGAELSIMAILMLVPAR